MKKQTILMVVLSALLVACGQEKKDDKYTVTLVEFAEVEGHRYKKTTAYLTDKLIEKSKALYDYFVSCDVEKQDMSEVDGWEGTNEYECKMDNTFIYIPTDSEEKGAFYASMAADDKDFKTYHAWYISEVPSEKLEAIQSLRTEYKKLVTSKNAEVKLC